MSKRRKLLIGGGAAIALILAFRFMGWLSLEPTFQRRSVTQWLDQMALFEEFRQADETGQRNFANAWSPSVVTNDPSLKALLAIGPEAVPTLLKRAAPEPSWWDVEMSWGERARTFWTEVRYGSGSIFSPDLPRRWGSHTAARSQAAYLTLLALGTNQNAGMLVALETYANSPRTTKGAVNRSFAFFDAVGAAVSGLPVRRAEMISGVEAGLQHTNAVVRYAAVNSVRHIWGPHSNWFPVLLPLVEDPDENVAASAMIILAAKVVGETEFLELAAAKLADRNAHTLIRARAAAALALAGDASVRFLPILREAAATTDPTLKSESLRAIKQIEESIAAQASKPHRDADVPTD